MGKDILKIGGSFLAGLAVGGLVGYFVTRKSAEIAYASIASEEIQKVKEYYHEINFPEQEDSEAPDVTDRLSPEDYNSILHSLGYSKEKLDSVTENLIPELFSRPDAAEIIKAAIESNTIEVTEEELDPSKAILGILNADPMDVPVTNIFDDMEYDDSNEGPEFYESVEHRKPNKPYLIHVNEFMDEDNENEKITLTYFEGDETLTDETMKVIPDVERLLGTEALVSFGKFSQDKNLVYVRNERDPQNKMDFEVIREPGDYATEILGVKNDPPIIRKMREDD